MSEIEKQATEKFGKSLEEYVQGRFGHDKKCVYVLGCTVDAKLDEVSLYLRFKPAPGTWPVNTLVIARIEFAEERCGHGTDLLKKLVEWSSTYGYTHIGMESLSTDAIQHFVRKFGFSPYKEGDRHWLVSVEKLVAHYFNVELS